MPHSNSSAIDTARNSYNHEAPIPAKRVYRESYSVQTFYRYLNKFGADAMGAVRAPGGRWFLYPSAHRDFLERRRDEKQGSVPE